MKLLSIVAIITVPWIIAFVAPGYVRAINEPIRQTYQFTGGTLFSCTIHSYDYFLRSVLISLPICIACILALAIWAYFLSSRPDYITKRHAMRLRKIGFDAVRKELLKPAQRLKG